MFWRPCMISRIWGLKQLWLQKNSHGWFHLHGLRWASRNGEGVNNSKWKYKSPTGFDVYTPLKLYCGYKYTRPCMINRIWGLHQLWLQMNGHGWFHLHVLRWAIRKGEGANNSKWKYMSPTGFEPTPGTPRQVNKGFRPLGHDASMTICGLMSYRKVGCTLIETLRDMCQIDYDYMCIGTDCQTISTFLIPM